MVAGQQRAVEDFGVRVDGALADAGVQKDGGGGENHVVTVLDEALDDLLRVLLRDVFAADGFHAGTEGILERLAPQLVPIRPAGILRRAVVEERAAHRLRRLVPDGLQEARLGLRRLGEQRGGLVGRGDDKFRPDPLDLLPELGGRFLHAVLVAENLQIDQQRVAGGHWRVALGLGVVRLLEAVEAGLKIKQIFRRPLLARRFAHQLIELFIAALAGEGDEIDLRIGVKAQKFLIDAVALAVLRFRQDAGDVRLDAHRIEPAHDAHALVALHDVKAVIVFQRDDGLAQAVFHNAVVEHAPLGGKLGILLEQRHEAARKRRRAPLRRRALDLIQRDLHQPKRHLRQLVEGGHKLGQHRQIRVLPARLRGVLLLEPLFSGGEIMFHAHGGTLPSASMNVRIFFHDYSIACARAQPSLDEWGRLCYNFREERRAL